MDDCSKTTIMLIPGGFQVSTEFDVQARLKASKTKEYPYAFTCAFNRATADTTIPQKSSDGNSMWRFPIGCKVRVNQGVPNKHEGRVGTVLAEHGPYAHDDWFSYDVKLDREPGRCEWLWRWSGPIVTHEENYCLEPVDLPENPCAWRDWPGGGIRDGRKG